MAVGSEGTMVELGTKTERKRPQTPTITRILAD
jgi:hypothetical protein